MSKNKKNNQSLAVQITVTMISSAGGLRTRLRQMFLGVNNMPSEKSSWATMLQKCKRFHIFRFPVITGHVPPLLLNQQWLASERLCRSKASGKQSRLTNQWSHDWHWNPALTHPSSWARKCWICRLNGFQWFSLNTSNMDRWLSKTFTSEGDLLKI